MSDLEKRVAALEGTRDREGRLVEGVERLADETGGLNAILRQVDEQQQRLTDLSQRTGAIEGKADRAERSAEKAAFTAEERLATAQVERKIFLRQVYATTAGAIVIALAAVIGGAWLTDKHTNDCIIDGPTTPGAERFCNLTFPGHDHPSEKSLAGLLYTAAVQRHESCLNINMRTERNIAREKILAELATNPRERQVHLDYVAESEPLVTDCDKTAPLPPPLPED